MLRRMIVIVSALILWSCASVPKAEPELQARALTFQPTPGAARIYVIRPEGVMGVIVPLEVVVDSMFVGKLTPGTFVMTDVPPGSHVLACPTGESRAKLALETEPDSVYFVKLVPDWGMWMASAILERLEPAEGRKRVLETEMVRREGLQDQ
jgi:hypothetical protein